MAYFSGQGRVYMARRDANGNPVSFRWVGNVPDLKVSFSVEMLEHNESVSGQRLTDLQVPKKTSGDVSCTLEDFSVENLELTLYGTTTKTTSGMVNDEALRSGIKAGEIVALTRRFVSDVVVKDSATVTPATLVEGTHYKILPDMGAIEFLDVGSFVQPFKVSYDYGASHGVAMFRTPQPEVWLRFVGINTAAGNAPVILDLYKVSVNPTKDLSLISDDLQKFELSGKVLADITKGSDPTFGQFGRIEMKQA